MALSQPSEVPDSVRVAVQPTQPVVRNNNIIPFPLSRALLPVTLLRQSEDEARAQLKALLHSPLGVYVVRTEVVRDGVRVLFSIAREDLDFTLHTLIAAVPHALIGSLSRTGPSKEAH